MAGTWRSSFPACPHFDGQELETTPNLVFVASNKKKLNVSSGVSFSAGARTFEAHYCVNADLFWFGSHDEPPYV